MEKVLLKNIRPGEEPLDLAAYQKVGGYASVRKALKEMSPEDVQNAVKESKLRGRGGAGFPTGVKWGFVPMGDDAPRPKYMIANADEMEPGTFKDRAILEGDPHLMVESMIVSSYAIQAEEGYIFLRWAYRLAKDRLEKAIAEAYDAGLLGKNILGTDYSLELHLHISAGRYMCGEETGLLNALEGRRATPRDKPPFPTAVGAFGKPSVVNNVETLCNVPAIVNKGADWFLDLSNSDDGGTKLYGVSGRVKNPGLWELPLGTPLREILEEHAGGMQENYALRAVIPGGGSTNFLVEEHFDEKMDFDTIQGLGSRLGTGTIIVLDDQTCPIGMVHNLEKFFSRESCGWCTPCREGLPWVQRVLGALEEGHGSEQDPEVLEMHTSFLGPGNTFCALAPGAIEPLKGLLKYFREDINRHIQEGKCPWR